MKHLYYIFQKLEGMISIWVLSLCDTVKIQLVVRYRKRTCATIYEALEIEHAKSNDKSKDMGHIYICRKKSL